MSFWKWIPPERDNSRDVFHSSFQKDLERSSKNGCARRLGDGRQPTGTVVVVVGRCPVVDCHSQILEERE